MEAFLGPEGCPVGAMGRGKNISVPNKPETCVVLHQRSSQHEESGRGVAETRTRLVCWVYMTYRDLVMAALSCWWLICDF